MPDINEPTPGKFIEPLPPTSEQVDAPADPMVAFGRFVKQEMYDVFGEYDFESLTDAEKLWVEPRNIAPHLFEAPHGSVLAVPYTTRGRSRDFLALPAAEFNWIARYPRALGRSSVTGALKDNDLSDEVMAASNRARLHVFDQKIARMQSHSDNLEGRREEIVFLRRRIKTPGYAHVRATRMAQLVSGLWQEGITILDVLHVQRNWDDEQRTRAEAAMVAYLTHGPQNTRIAHWGEFANLAESYLSARAGLFKGRIREVKARLGE